MKEEAESAEVFSWVLKINDKDIMLPFGNMEFSRKIKGFGEKGISIGVFKFDIYDMYGIYSGGSLEKATVQLFDANKKMQPSKKYYIARRSVTDDVCSFTAYDVMANTEMKFDPTRLNVFFDRNETAPCGNVLSEISAQCGFKTMSASDSGLELIRFNEKQVTDKSCADIMDMISETLVGVWISDENENAVLCCLGSRYYNTPSYVYSDEYSHINMHGSQKITALICKNSETGAQKKYNSNTYGFVIETESPFLAAGTALDDIVWGRINGYEYNSWSCDKAVLNYIADAPANIDFSGTGEFYANKSEISVNGTGIYFSGGTEPRDDEQWLYDDYNQRQINARLEFDKTAGNIQIGNETGIVFINKNKTSSIALDNNSEIEKYGFNVDVGGVTEYDGAIVSNTVFETAEKIDDNTIIISYPGNIRYKYTLGTDENGKTTIQKERMEEGEQNG